MQMAHPCEGTPVPGWVGIGGMIDTLVYFVARALVSLIQAFPLTWVARMGRVGGAVAYWLDARHRRMALKNLRQSFPEQFDQAQAVACIREHFRRLGENYCCAIKTASMDQKALLAHLTWGNDSLIREWMAAHPGRSLIGAIGHFGNFELYARFGQVIHGIQPATTYRGLKQPGLNRLLQSIRARSGCLFFERRSDAGALREALSRGGLLLGLLADQHAGDRGLPLPFLGRICSTSAAPALLALRYNTPLSVAICYRVGLARWRIEFSPFIPTHEPDGNPRSASAIMSDVNRHYEDAIRRDPPNWFWVHNRWKPGKHRKASEPQEISPDGAGLSEEPHQP